MLNVTPFLLFQDDLNEVIAYYTGIFKEARAGSVINMAPGVASATLELAGQTIMLLQGGPKVRSTDAFSLFVRCEDQAEIDHLWDSLTAQGKESRCGWLVDKYGFSWQIIPASLGALMHSPDPVKAQRVMQAMLQMNKIIIKDLEDAHKDA